MGARCGCAPASESEETEPAPTASQVLKLEELTFTDIEQIDRNNSIFFLTFGNLEEHGPHIPVGSDYFQAVGVRNRLIARLQEAHPDYKLVVVPVVPLAARGESRG